MPQFRYDIIGIIAAGFTGIIGFFTAVLGYHTKHNYVKREDFKKHCSDMRTACNKQICGKIDELKRGQDIVFNKLDVMIGDISTLRSQISALESSFLQYKEDKRNGIK